MKKQSKTSLQKKINRNDLLNGISTFAVAAALLLFGFMCYSYIAEYITAMRPRVIVEYGTKISGLEALKHYYYIADLGCTSFVGESTGNISYTDHSGYNLISMIAAGLAGIIVGVFQFSFLHNKTKLTSVLSMAVSRAKIFKNRVKSGSVMLGAAILIPAFIALIFKLLIFGFRGMVFASIIISVSYNVLFALLGFSAAVLGAVLSGRTEEGAAFSLSLMILPPVFIYFVNTLFKITLYGYPSDISESTLFTDFSSGPFTEIARTSDPLSNIFMGLYDRDNTPLYNLGIMNDSYTFSELLPDIISIILFAALSIAIIVLTKKIFIKSFKPEKAGNRGIAKFVNAIITGVYSTALLSIYFEFFISYYYYDNIDLKTFIPLIAIGLIIILVSSFIIEQSIHFSKKKFLYVLKRTPLYLIPSALVLLITVTGAFGFSSRIPDSDDIMSVQMDMPISGIFFNGEYTASHMQYYSPENENAQTSLSKNDIDILLNVHESAVKNRDTTTNSTFSVKYTLKNGKELHRTYSHISKETEAAAMKLFETDCSKELRKEYLLGTYDKSAETYKSYVLKVTDYKAGNLYLVNNDASYTYITSKLSESQFIALKKALWADTENMTFAEMFTPSEAAVCTLVFSENRYADEFSGSFPKGSFRSQMGMPAYSFCANYNITVYPSMKNTIKLLNDCKLMGFTKQKKTIESITLVSTDECAKFFFIEEYDKYPYIAPYFNTYEYIRMTESQHFNDIDSFESKIVLTDKKECEDIYKHCFTSYYIRGGGQLAEIKFTDGSVITYFAP